MRSPTAFWFELRRRNVIRAAVLYVGAVWALAQGIAQLAPVFGLPDSFTRWFVLACTIGFPFWLVLAWLYELTPTGLRREAEAAVEPGAARPRANRRRLDYAIIAVLSVAVVLLGTDALVGRRKAVTPAGAAGPATAFASIPEQSIAVLPLANESGNPDEQYLSDGISEDLISALSQVVGLKVIARNSAFQFRASQDRPRQIALALGVAHLLEGSFRHTGDEVRIRVELIKAADGSTVWSQRYVRPYRDLFSVQDEIVASAAEALRARLLDAGTAAVQAERPPSGDLGAYNSYLQGRAYAKQGTEAGLRNAIVAYGEATRVDPRYARAFAALSRAWGNLSVQFLGGGEQRLAYARSRAAANTAVTLDPGLAAAHIARGWLLLTADLDWSGAEAAYRRALTLAPNDTEAQLHLAELLATLGQPQAALELTRAALTNDPRLAGAHAMLAAYLSALGRYDEAARAINAALMLQPDAAFFHSQLVVIEILRGNPKGALAVAHQEVEEGGWREIALALAQQASGDRAAANAAMDALVAHQGGDAPYFVAQAYALRNDANGVFRWLERAWNSRDGGIGYLLYDPILLRYRNDPRFAAFCIKAGLPLPADGRAPGGAAVAAGARR